MRHGRLLAYRGRDAMNTPFDIDLETVTQDAADAAVAGVLASLRLEALPIPGGAERAPLLKRTGAPPLATLVRESESLRDDVAAIESVKSQAPSMPIIFLSRSARPRRESAIRRLGIHYFLAHPIDGEELRLVRDVLMRPREPPA